jgi:hypothetical protein
MDEYTVFIVKQRIYSTIFMIVGFLFVLTGIFIVNWRSQKPKLNDPVSKYFSKQKIIIENQTKKLQHQIDSLNFRIEQNSLVLDKISKSKTQIKYVYINQIQQIDSLNNNGIVREFKSFFSKTNFK